MKITLLTGKTYNIEQEIDFPIKIVKSPRAKKLTLRIDSKEHIPVLSLPRYCSQKKAIDFVLLHKEWIQDSLNKLPQSKPFENGERITTSNSSGYRGEKIFIENGIVYSEWTSLGDMLPETIARCAIKYVEEINRVVQEEQKMREKENITC